MRNLKKSAHVYTERSRSGFTLVELLVVIAIIAILAAVVVLIVNPIELMKRSRDAARLTDLANLQQAINVAAQEATSSGNEILCFGTTVPCQGNSGGGASRASNGTGWVKVNLSGKSVSVPTLPIDPLNTGTNIYSYASDGSTWEINAVLESIQQVETNKRMEVDGGDNLAVYEVGSKLDLIN